MLEIVYENENRTCGSVESLLPELEEWLAQGNVILPAHPPGYPDRLKAPAYLDHALCKQPTDDHLVWRYMSFEQLAILLAKRALWFTRCVNFQKDDPYEGTHSDPLRSLLDQNPAVSYGDLPGFSEAQKALIAGQAERSYEVFLRSLVGCFNLAQHESNAMWHVYGKGDNCIAITTTLGSLKKAFGPYTSYDVHIGQIEYIDHKTAPMAPDNFLVPLLYKAQFYEFEHELRCLIVDAGDNELFDENEPDPRDLLGSGVTREFAPGCYVQMDLGELLGEIVIGPRSAPWFADAVSAMLKAFQMDVPIRKSKLFSRA
ncbi:MAG: hypothetical protein V4858_12550 [Pseudomonadota bacterium]